MQDYFHLLSVELSPEIRRKLDCAMHLAEHPMPEAYAHILPAYDGNCPMRMEDGRCALQAEAGESVLADVCRLYPRGIHTGEGYECSCANSCEAVLEIFLERKMPLTFERVRMGIKAPRQGGRMHHFEHGGRQLELRLWLISLVQEREYPLPQRMLLLGEAILEMDSAMRSKDWSRIEAFISGAERLPLPEIIQAGHDQVRIGLGIASHMLEFMDERSNSIREYGEKAIGCFCSGEDEFDKYCDACRRFEKVVPQWETWFEHMIVNHMFFSQFPFQDRPVDVKDEFLGLCTVYMMLRFLCVGWTAERNDVQSAVDAAAAAFRLIDHTEYDRYAAPVLKKFGHDNWVEMREILCL